MPRRRGGRRKGRRKRKTTRLLRLPEHIIQEIFHRLPFKTMVRSMLVSKRWNALTSDPIFTNADHKRRTEGNHLILWETKCLRTFDFYTLNYSSLVDEASSSSIAPVDDPHVRGWCEPRLLGSCNGLVAISCYEKLVLWNPLTSVHYSVLANVYNSDTDFNNFIPRIMYGLCYDAASDEYSVVVGSDYQSPPVSPRSFSESIEYESTCVWLYRFRDGNERMLQYSALGRRLLDSVLFRGEVGKVVCGVPHWVVQFYDFREPRVKREILYFDLKEEKFMQMAGPGGGAEKTMLGLAAMNGESELGVVIRDDVGSFLDVWVMKEYHEVESWTNMFTIPQVNITSSLRYMNVFGFMSSGELLIEVNRHELWAYDIEKNTSRRIKLWAKSVHSMIVYEPKLISPHRSERAKKAKAQEGTEN